MNFSGMITFFFFWLCAFACGAGVVLLSGLLLVLEPKIPSVTSLKDTKLETPLRVYSKDLKLIAEFGEKKRSILKYHQIPPLFIKALLSAEDENFFFHPGFDPKGLGRAVVELVKTGEKRSGGSTITMQVARNFFLSTEQTFTRKFSEILLALEIEKELSKQEIMERYVNKIYLGHRSYGIEAAAKVYYGASIDTLDLSQIAMIAGLPKAPSKYNPITNPERAMERRNWILDRMLKLKFINPEEHQFSIDQPNTAKFHTQEIGLSAPYIAEMARKETFDLLGEQVYTNGYTVITTVDDTLQKHANQVLLQGLIDYDKRHGYRGAEKKIALLPSEKNKTKKAHTKTSDDLADEMEDIFSVMFDIGPLKPAVVTKVEPNIASVTLQDGSTGKILLENALWAKKYIDANRTTPPPKSLKEILQPGDVIRVTLIPEPEQLAPKPEQLALKPEQPAPKPKQLINTQEPEAKQKDREVLLAQLPELQGAIVSLDPKTGAIVAAVGGSSFDLSHFNRVNQAARQAGSSFKPFIYASAMANGYTAASIINDAPFAIWDPGQQREWRPKNVTGKYYGPTRLRQALYESRNLVSVRLLHQLGVKKAVKYIESLGFSKQKLPANLSIALGTSEFTPLEIATGYAIFANGGYQVKNHIIDRILDTEGREIYKNQAPVVCPDCKNQEPTSLPPALRVMDENTHFVIHSILSDVVDKGTATKAKVLGRKDLAGKTGTTNDQHDTWFSGFNTHLVTTVWVGFDTPKSIGKNEYGSTASLPIWINFMEKALAGKPDVIPKQPDTLVTVRIDPSTGKPTGPGSPNAIFEYFPKEKADKISKEAITQSETTDNPTEYTETNSSQEPSDEQLQKNIEAIF